MSSKSHDIRPGDLYITPECWTQFIVSVCTDVKNDMRITWIDVPPSKRSYFGTMVCSTYLKPDDDLFEPRPSNFRVRGRRRVNDGDER